SSLGALLLFADRSPPRRTGGHARPTLSLPPHRRRYGRAPGRHRHSGPVSIRPARVCRGRHPGDEPAFDRNITRVSFLSPMLLQVRHVTRYDYDPPAHRASLRLKLYPPRFEAQAPGEWRVSVNGEEIRPMLINALGEGEA